MTVDMIINNQPPAYRIRPVALPLSCLNIMEAGVGEPLIVVPATISELGNWVDLIQFMAQWFHVYFFELPGHGLSTPFEQKFSTRLVAQTVEQLADHLQIQNFNLMGFSFGGILAMRTFNLLQHRIDRLILNAPCLTNRAVMLSRTQKLAMRSFGTLLGRRAVQEGLYRAMRHPRRRTAFMDIFQRVGKVENRQHVEQKLAKIEISTLDVLGQQIMETMKFESPHPAVKYNTPCYFTMSVNDPLLDYEITLNELQSNFSNVHLTKLFYPFHQPPKPFTFDELNHDFGESVRRFVLNDTLFSEPRPHKDMGKTKFTGVYDSAD